MNLLTILQNSWHKLMASQLRMPSGFLAKITGNKMNKSNELLYRLTLENLPIKTGDHILEIGFGNGKFFSKIFEKAKNVTAAGIDHSPEMVAQAIKINRKLVESHQLNLLAGNSDQLPFEDHVFDLVFCINVIYFWDNPALHLQEIHRVLKPGGYFCAGFRPKENLSKFAFASFGFTHYSAEEWKSLTEENGFQFVAAQNGKALEQKMYPTGTPFESLCIIFKK